MATTQDVRVPDIGDYDNVPVIEVLVKPGDQVNKEDSLITLESDKATMEVPSPASGTVQEVKVKEGDEISQGDLVLTLEVAEEAGAAVGETSPAVEQASSPVVARAEAPAQASPAQVAEQSAPQAPPPAGLIHASPAVRRLARERGVDLRQVPGSGPKGRITKDDVEGLSCHGPASTSGAGLSAMGGELPAWPEVDFAQFGAIETQPLSRIQKISGPALHRNWVNIPHVTQFDEADITELEAFRKQEGEKAQAQGVKLTPLAFFMKASVAALKAFPTFNASLSPDGQSLILKKYYHLGVAVDTPDGLMVPVIRDVDQKGIYELAQELAEKAQKAREKKISPADLQGGCFSISSLGGIGGTAFTPIINAPEVAILGVSKTQRKPVYQDGEFVPRLMVPLSLSYDHRVIDGATGARFARYLAELLGDMRRLLL